MPTYTYYCARCDHDFCVERKMSDESVQECTQCGDVAKLRPSTTSFIMGGKFTAKNNYGLKG